MFRHASVSRRNALGMTLALGAAFAPRRAGAETLDLAGTWHGEQGGSPCALVLSADGRFTRRDDAPEARVAGRWRAAGDTLRLEVEEWSPRLYCDAIGCSPVRRAAETYRYAFEAPDRLLLENGMGRYAFRRIA